jgi:hypothetical protein
MLPAYKVATAIIPISKTNGATAVGEYIDRLGYDFIGIDVVASTANVVSNTLNVLAVAESDDTVVTNFAAVTGMDGGTGFTIATNAYTNTASQNLWSFRIDGRKRKRYLKVSASPQTTMVIAGIAHLHRGKEAPITASDANALNIVEG